MNALSGAAKNSTAFATSSGRPRNLTAWRASTYASFGGRVASLGQLRSFLSAPEDQPQPARPRPGTPAIGTSTL
jgi:hypothetical protein